MAAKKHIDLHSSELDKREPNSSFELTADHLRDQMSTWLSRNRG